nr:hypothetical protein [uncultured Desulfobacter sp.]
MSLIFEEKIYVIRGAVFEAYKKMCWEFLNAANLKLGRLINFVSHPKIQVDRFEANSSVLSVSSVLVNRI